MNKLIEGLFFFGLGFGIFFYTYLIITSVIGFYLNETFEQKSDSMSWECRILGYSSIILLTLGNILSSWNL